MDLFGDEIAHDNEYDDFSITDVNEVEQGLLPPSQSHDFIGHEKTQQNLLDLWNGGRFPHAIVFTGTKGIGKATMAYRLARFVLKNGQSNGGGLFDGEDLPTPETLDVAKNDPIFTKIASGGHPDFRSIGLIFDESKNEFKREISAEQIRTIPNFLHQTASDGGWRVVLVDDADKMNVTAQNALLKILEEPMAKTLIILIAHGAGGLLPTIRSRSRFVAFDPLSDEAFSTLMKQMDAGLAGQDQSILSQLAQGSVGQAQWLTDQGMDSIHKLLSFLSDLNEKQPVDIDQFALAFGKSGSRSVADLFAYVMKWYTKKRVVMAANNEQSHMIGPYQIANNAPLEQCLTQMDDVAEHLKNCRYSHLDTRFMVFKAVRLLQAV